MSKQRIVKDEIWDDDWFYDLDPTEKLVWLFLLTNPRGNIAGIYKLNKKWAAQTVGLELDIISTIISRFVNDGKILYESNWIGLVNFHKHLAYRNASVAQGIVRLHREGTGCPQALDSLWLTLLNSTLLYLSEGKDKSLQIMEEVKNEIMTFKAYNENEHHEDTPSIDVDSGEIIVPLEEKEKQRNKEKNTKKRELVDWLIKHQNRDPLRTNRPAQLKALNRLIEMNVSPEKIKNTLFECEASDFWQNKKEKPDFNTVKNIMEKRG